MQKSQSKPKINIEKLNSARREIENLKLEIQTLIKPTLWYNVTSVKEQESKKEISNNPAEPNVSSVKDTEVIPEENPRNTEKNAQSSKIISSITEPTKSQEELENVPQKVEIKNVKSLPKKSSNTPRGTLTPKSLFKNAEPKSRTENLPQNKNTLSEKQKICALHKDPSTKDEASKKSMTSFIKKQRQLRKEKILQEELKKNEIKNTRKKNLEILQQKQVELLKENIRKSKLSKKRASMTNLSKINQPSRVVELKRTKSLDRNVKLDDSCEKLEREPRSMKTIEEKSSTSVLSKHLTTEPKSSTRNSEKEKPNKIQAQKRENKNVIGKRLQNSGNLTEAIGRNIEIKSNSAENEITSKITTRNQIENSPNVQNKITKLLQSYTETDLCLKDNKYLLEEIKRNSSETSFKSASDTLLNKSIQVTNEIYLERSLVKPTGELRQLPIWLEKPEVLPYPYNFITTVKRKLDFATSNTSSPKSGVSISEIPVINPPKLPLEKTKSQKIQLSTIPVLTSPELSEDVPKTKSNSEQVSTSYSSLQQDKQVENTNAEKSTEVKQKVREKSQHSASEKSDSSNVKLSKSKETSKSASTGSSVKEELSKVSKRLDFSEKYDLKLPDMVLETKENSKRSSTSSNLKENLSKVSKRLDFSEKYDLKLPDMVLETKESSKSSGKKREVIDLSKVRSDSEHVNSESDRDTIKNISDLSLEVSSKKSSEKIVSELSQAKSSKSSNHKLSDDTDKKSIRTELSNLQENLDTIKTVSDISPEAISSKLDTNSVILTENPGTSFEKVPLNSRKIENLTLKYTKQTFTNMETYSDDFESVKIETSESESKISDEWKDLKQYSKDSFARFSKTDLTHSNILTGSQTKKESIETELKFSGQKFPLNKYIKKETINFIPKLEFRHVDNLNQSGVLNIEKENDKKVNPNGIHLKFQAELHMLNSFKNSLQQIIDIEKTIYGEEEKENTIMEIEKAKNLINNPLLNTINFKRGCDFGEDDRNSFNNTTQFNDKTTSDLEIYPNSSVKQNNSEIPRNEFNASLAMFDEMIKEEDKRLEKVKSVLKNKEKELLERTKGQLTLLEMRKRQSKDNGLLNDVTMIKKKQRGLIIKLEQERHEMQRLKQVHKEAAKQRKNALREQKNLIKAQLSSTDQIRSKIRRVSRSFKSHSGPIKVFRTEETFQEISHTLSCSEEVITNESAVSRISKDLTSEIEEYETKSTINMSQVKRFLQQREKCLEERQKNAEYVLAWHKRLEAKEALVKELEKKAQELTMKNPLALSAKRNTLNIDAYITKRSKENYLEISGTELENDFPKHFAQIDSKNKTNSSRSDIETPEFLLEQENSKFEKIYRSGSSSGVSESSKTTTHPKNKENILQNLPSQLKTTEIDTREKFTNEIYPTVTESKLKTTDLKQGLNKLEIFSSKFVPDTTPKSSLNHEDLITQNISKMSDMPSKSNAKKSETNDQLYPTNTVSSLNKIISQKENNKITSKSSISERIDSRTTINESLKSKINDINKKSSDSSRNKLTSDIPETLKTNSVDSLNLSSHLQVASLEKILTEVIDSINDDQIKTIQSEIDSNINSIQSSPKTTNKEETLSTNSQLNKIETDKNNTTRSTESNITEFMKSLSKNSNLKINSERNSSTINSDVFLPTNEILENEITEGILTIEGSENKNSEMQEKIISVASNENEITSEAIESEAYMSESKPIDSSVKSDIYSKNFSDYNEHVLSESALKTYESSFELENDNTINSGRKQLIKSDTERSVKSYIEGSIKSDIEGSRKSDIEGSIKSDIEGSIKLYIEGSIKSDIEGSIKSDIKESIKLDIDKSIKSDAEKSIKSDIEESIKSDIDESIKSDIEKSIKSDIEGSIKSGIDESIKSDIDESIKSDIEKSIKSDINESIKSDSKESYLRESSKSDIKESLKSYPEKSLISDLKESLKSGIEELIKSDTKESLKSYITESTKSVRKESLQSDIKESLKSGTKESLKSDIEESLKSDIEESLKSDVEETLKSGTNKSLQSDIKESLQYDIEESLKFDIEGSLKSDIEGSLKSGVEESRKSYTEKSLKSYLKDSSKSDIEVLIKSDTNKSLKSDTKGSLKSDSKGSLKSDTNGSLKSDTRGSLKSDTRGSLKSDIEESLQSDIGESTKSYTKESLKIDLRESSKSDIKESLKSDIGESTKSYTKESLKSGTTETSKSDIKESSKSDAKESLKSDIKESLKYDIGESTKSYTKESLKSGTTETSKSDIKESSKSDTKESLKSDIKESLNSDIGESTKSYPKESLKSDTKESLKSDIEKSLKSDIEESLKSDIKDSTTFCSKELLKSHTKESLKSGINELTKSDRKESVSKDITEFTESNESKLERKLNLVGSIESKNLREVSDPQSDSKEIISPTQTTDSKQNELSEKQTDSKTSKVYSLESITEPRNSSSIEIKDYSSKGTISEQSNDIELSRSGSELGVNVSIELNENNFKKPVSKYSSKIESPERSLSSLLEDETDRSKTVQSLKEMSESEDLSGKLDKSEQSLLVSSPKSTQTTKKRNRFDSAVSFDITQSDDNIVVEITNKDIASLTSIRDTEAELLRKQMEIEYEIKQLERQELERQQLENIYFIREIPNKPPPPYKFPDENSSVPEAAKIPPVSSMLPTDPEQITTLVSKSINILYPTTSDLNSSTNLDLKNTQVGEKFVFDLCKEIIYDIYNNPNDQTGLPTWKLSRRKQFAEILTQNKPRNQRDLEKFVLKKALSLLSRRDNSIIRCNRRKRDHVDEILIAESKSEEYEWVNFDFDEIVLKDKLTNDLLSSLVFDTITVINNAIYKKKTLHWF